MEAATRLPGPEGAGLGPVAQAEGVLRAQRSAGTAFPRHMLPPGLGPAPRHGFRAPGL